jgi:hypothetical protein
MTGKAKGTSNIERVRAWFVEHPFDFAAYKDLQAAFGLTPIQLRDILKALRKEGLIESGPAAWKKPTEVAP